MKHKVSVSEKLIFVIKCNILGCKRLKKNKNSFEQEDWMFSSSPCTRQGTNDYRPKKTSSATESVVAKRYYKINTQ